MASFKVGSKIAFMIEGKTNLQARPFKLGNQSVFLSTFCPPKSTFEAGRIDFLRQAYFYYYKK